MNRELPPGWAERGLRECVDVLDNRRVPVNSDDRADRQGQIPYYGATGQVGWIDDFLFDEELLLIGEDGAPFFDKSKPIAYIINGKTWVNNHAHVLRAMPDVTSNRFLKHFLDWFDFHDYVNGTTRLKLTQGSMNQIPVLLPPLVEQQRIVAKLEVLLGKVGACRKRLEKIPVILKRFRQSVLAAACTGRLTADWRGVGYSNEEFPDGWGLRKLDSLFTIRTGGTPSRKVKEYFDGGTIPWVKTGEVQNCDISRTEEFITEAAVNASNAKAFPSGTIVVAMYGEGRTRGQIGRLTFPAATNQACAALINTDLPRVTNQFVFYALLGQYDLLRAQSAGGNQPNLNLGIIKEWEIPMPPLPEQQEIVRRVEALFALADQIESRYAKAKTHVDRLTLSILAKAFRGDLVPQDPDDEPASVLLDRIRSQRQEVDVRRRQPKCKRATAADTAGAPSPHNLT